MMGHETDAERTLRLALERHVRDLLTELHKNAPRPWGFALVLFDLSDGSVMAYSSNAKPEDVSNVLRDVVEKLAP